MEFATAFTLKMFGGLQQCVRGFSPRVQRTSLSLATALDYSMEPASLFSSSHPMEFAGHNDVVLIINQMSPSGRSATHLSTHTSMPRPP